MRFSLWMTSRRVGHQFAYPRLSSGRPTSSRTTPALSLSASVVLGRNWRITWSSGAPRLVSSSAPLDTSPGAPMLAVLDQLVALRAPGPRSAAPVL
ncbi:hypothetical protein NGM33_06960 [Nocardiopsis dassonvillei]|uniref:hypothetical protein n=1 Tax=Nocardiopsis dassonvillei TaxID=2014 RepID=UPI0020A322D1|nr:hypothetical protein [Nocardiopsis dassonvillei]MCP3013068.1 hypothetical protein [Nocardiopsis dassonvillei]